MVARPSRRLPGVRFEAQPPPLMEVLPRMDVAAFVGFAASGPLHKPVVVEDVAHFAAIFGDDVPLAWDQQHNELVYAYLGPSVRAFFRNGGHRCWVVRVAGEQAQLNYFPVPGLAQVDAEGRIAPAFARARSQGSWSDNMRVSTALLSRPVTVEQVVSFEPPVVYLTETSPDDVAVGDLLRLTFTPDSQGIPGEQTTYEWLLLVQSLKSLAQDVGSSPRSLYDTGRDFAQVTGRTISWLTPLEATSPIVLPEQAVFFTYQPGQGVIEHAVSVHDYSIAKDDQTITVTLATDLTAAPKAGTFVRLDYTAGQAFMVVQSVDVTYDHGSTPGEMVEVKGQGRVVLNDTPSISPPSPPESPRAERLTFELWTRQEDSYALHLSDLAFDARRPRFWGALPIDEQLYDVTRMPFTTTPVNLWQATPPNSAYTALWQAANWPRFPLAGLPVSSLSTSYIPVAMSPLPELFVGVTRPFDQQTADPLVRDGLDDFQDDLFLDPGLRDAFTSELIPRADFLRYQVSDPQPLRDTQTTSAPADAPLVDVPAQLKGIHAVLDIEEATLIAVPDAVHRGWVLAQEDGSPAQPLPTVPGISSTPKPVFFTCTTNTLQPPDLSTHEPLTGQSTFTLIWSTINTEIDSATGEKTTNYTLEEATRPDFRDAANIYQGKEHERTLYGRSPGNYYYRVRAEGDGLVSDWSIPLLVHIAPLSSWRSSAADEYKPDTLLAIQRALLRLCAARGDICAVLTLPEHYREDETVAHVGRLKAAFDLPIDVPARPPAPVPPLSSGETPAFSYGALYHPWLFTREETQASTVRRGPPDGAVSGMIALRAITRGAWVAAANVPLLGVVALTPPIGRGSWLRLLEAQVNLVRQEPRGFLTLNADTLSSDGDDDDLRPLNVRRLLILLRRLALRLGTSYVFEPDSDSFRRLVQRAFEEALEQLFTRGAFAGDTTATAFEVVIGEEVNTPQSLDEGQLIVELRVAPSLPLTFLTVRLILQPGGSEAAVTEGR